MKEESGLADVLAALLFAAHKHRDQRRKGEGAPPFINHAIEVVEMLVRIGGVTDTATLQAAVLHDTLEDTNTTTAELQARFGDTVASIVEEVTDDTSLPYTERRLAQIENAPRLSPQACLVRIADKIANVEAVAWGPPVGWTPERRRDYLLWTEQVVAGCRGTNPKLERHFDEVLEEGLRIVEDNSPADSRE